MVQQRQQPRREGRRRTVEMLADTFTDMATRVSLFSDAENYDELTTGAMPLTLDDSITVDKFKVR